MGFGNMNFFTVFVVVVSLMVNVEHGVMGFKEVKVGGVHGWRVPEGNNGTDFYTKWAASKRFHVGDSLRFEYKNDTVLVVDKYGYYHCDASKASSTFNDGNTTIKLDHPGATYFISATPDHCRVGQRLEVDVMSPHPTPIATPPTKANVPAQSPGLAPGASPKHSGAGVVRGSFVLGVLVVVVSLSSLLLA